MSFSAEKLTGKVWTVDPALLPELMVEHCNFSTQWDWAPADKVPPVQVSRVEPGATGVDVHTGSFVPQPVTAKWCFDFSNPEAQSGMLVTDVECSYAGPTGNHNSNAGRYLLTLTLVGVDRRRPPFAINNRYLVELYMNGPGSRPLRITGMGMMVHMSRGASKTEAECDFEFNGNFHPERNKHLAPNKPMPSWVPQPPPQLVEPVYIEVAAAPLSEPVRRVGKRNIRLEISNPD